MDDAGVYKVLTAIFAEIFMRDIELRPELMARDVPEWDSFRQIDIIVALEEHYDIKFQIKELDGLNNVGDLARLIETRVGV